MKKKIAVIGLKGLPAFGGAASVGENLIYNLKDDFDFTVYSTSSHTEKGTGKYEGYYQIVFKKLPFKKLNTLYYYILSSLHAVFLSKYDIIHLHHRDAAFLIPFLKIKYKVVLTTHSSFSVPDKWRKFKYYFHINERYFVKYADDIIVVSKQEKRDYLKILKLDVKYIPNGISIDYANVTPYKNSNPYLFFGAGRILRIKGLHTLLKAMNYMELKMPLFVAGDLEQVPEYKEYLLDLSTTLEVKFLGLIKNKNKLLSYVKGSEIFVFPSTSEAMSIMLLEAISLNKPIICSDIVQNRDILDESEVLFFQTDNYIDLANKINWAIENKDKMRLKSRLAFQKFKVKYNWIKISKEYKSIYNELL